jgi:hypothetical protein
MIVRNITFLEYAALKDRGQYDYYLRYGNFKPDDYFNLGDFTKQNFGFVKDMQDYLNHTGLTWQIFIEEMAKKKKWPMKKIARTPVFFLQQARLYVKEQIENINFIENRALSYSPSAKEESAGINTFEKYRAFVQYDQLTGGDLLKLERVKNLSYTLCFTKLSLEADKSAYERDLKSKR